MTHNPQRYLANAATASSLQSDREQELLDAFLASQPEDFIRWEGHAGTPSASNIVYFEVELHSGSLRRVIDAVVFYHGFYFYLVEVKETLDDEVVGQLSTDETLFKQTEPLGQFANEEQLTKLAVVNDADPEMRQMVEREHNIEVRTVDEGL